MGQHFDIDNIDDVNRILVNAANTCTIITQCRIDVGDDTIDKKKTCIGHASNPKSSSFS